MTKHWLNTRVNSIDLDKAKCELPNCFLSTFKHVKHLEILPVETFAFSSNWGLKTTEIAKFFFFSCDNDLFSLFPIPPLQEFTLNSFAIFFF